MRQLRLARLLRIQPTRDRVFFHSVWFRGHNNPRYAELLPRLDRVDAYLPTCSDHRILRGLQFRALRRTEQLRYAALFPRVSNKYRGLFAADPNQARYFDGPVVVDVDDPKFTAREAALLARENVAAYVVTDERTAHRYVELGVDRPYEVIPQGVDLDAVDQGRVDEIRARRRSPDEVIVGYVAAWLLTGADRDGANPLYNVDHLLLELWPAIREAVPDARLWLVGRPSDRVAREYADRPDIVLLGRLSQTEVLHHVAAFDLALYPRRVEHTVRTVKVAEYMGLGIPTVSYDLDIVNDLRASGGGLLAGTPTEFVDAVATLATRPGLRRERGEAARAYAAGWSWAILGDRYRDLLDRHLPPR
jgi:glycosyltransferase involved in cell wall biosynthesis